MRKNKINNLYEAYNYDISYRAILNFRKNEKIIKVFTEKEFIEVTSEVEFDTEKNHLSSLNYFASSIIGGILQSLVTNAERSNILLEDLEGKIKLNLKNPLTLLNVKGYEEEPRIKKCYITIYYYSELDEGIIVDFFYETLKKCYIYNTIKDSIEIDIKFILVV